MSLLDTVTGWRWKLAAAAGGIALALAAFFLVQAQMENRHLIKINSQLDARINDRSTGYVAQLAQATTNVAQLEAALDTQNTKLKSQAAESGAKLAALTAEVTRVQRENVKLRTDAAQIMAAPPQGNTLEQRILDIDRRNLETME